VLPTDAQPGSSADAAGIAPAYVRRMTLALLLADTWDMHGNDIGTGWWIVMMLGMVLFWGLLIFAVIWLVREYGHPSRRSGGPDHPQTILDRRFANGEITAKEYEERRRLLTGS
jgi:putative membrane protein